MAHTEQPAENPNQTYLTVLEAALRDSDNDFVRSLLEDSGPFNGERELADALVSAAQAADVVADKALWYGAVELLYDRCSANTASPEIRETLRVAHTKARHFLDVYYHLSQGDDAPGELPVDSFAETHDPTDPFAGLVEADDLIHGAAVDVEPYDPEGWEDDHFVSDFDDEPFKENEMLQHAIKVVMINKNIDLGIAIVEGEAEGETLAVFRRMLDKYVYEFAEGMIKDRHNLAAGVGIVEDYASSPEIAFQMRLSLDKLVMKEASNMITTYSSPGSARRIIEEGASAPARRDAMLLRLGLK